MLLILEVEDIYFITGLSRRGEVEKLQECGIGSGLTIHDYIVVYFLSDTEKVRIQIPMNSTENLGLKAILLALGRIAGLASLHQYSRPLMFYVMKCMCPAIYYWSTSLLSNMKQYLTDCTMGKVKNFGYDSILSAFF